MFPRTFRLKPEAEAGAFGAEHSVQTGKDPDTVQIDPKALFGTLIDLHITDLAEVSKPLLRSKAMCPEKLNRDLDRERLSNITPQRLIDFGKQRAREAAGPMTLSIDLG